MPKRDAPDEPPHDGRDESPHGHAVVDQQDVQQRRKAARQIVDFGKQTQKLGLADGLRGGGGERTHAFGP